MSPNYEFIGIMIKETRNRRRISQATLAERIDMSASYISHIETGKKQASLDAIARIAKILGVAIDYLIYGSPINDLEKNQSEFDLLLADCSNFERRVIFENACSLKMSLKNNSRLLKATEID